MVKAKSKTSNEHFKINEKKMIRTFYVINPVSFNDETMELCVGTVQQHIHATLRPNAIGGFES